MRKFDRNHILECARRTEELAKFGKRALPDSVKRLYVEFLAPLTPEELELAFKAWIFKSTRFPSPEELLACCGKSPSQRAETNWLTLDIKRDHIADEVCRKHQILASLRLCGHGSEYEAGIARRELKKRFIDLYEVEWFKWWSTGEIDAGESIIDFTPKTVIPKPIAPEDKLTGAQISILTERISTLFDKRPKPKREKMSPEDIAKIEAELMDGSGADIPQIENDDEFLEP
jgi:hypothetical protein